MDYLGWELERQRWALRAVLLGGGAPEAEPGGGEQAPEGAAPAEAGRGAAASAATGESAGEAVFPGAREAVRRASRGRRSEGEASAAGTPPSAWETVLGQAAERLGEAPDGGGSAGRVPGRSRGPAREAAGRGALAGFGPGGTERETAAEELAEPARNAAGAAGRIRAGEDPAGGAADEGGAPSPTMRPGGGETAGSTAAAKRTGGMEAPSWGGAVPAGGAEERLSRSVPWGDGGESAALRAEDQARAVSRAVQRDARRYDGGLYID